MIIDYKLLLVISLNNQPSTELVPRSIFSAISINLENSRTKEVANSSFVILGQLSEIFLLTAILARPLESLNLL